MPDASQFLQVFFIVFGIIFLGVVGLIIYKGLSDAKKPISTANATVVFKFVKANETTSSGSSFGTGFSSSSSSDVTLKYGNDYTVVFQFDNASKRRFFVSKDEYQRLNEGDRGLLSFQGGGYLGFQKEDQNNGNNLK